MREILAVGVGAFVGAPGLLAAAPPPTLPPQAKPPVVQGAEVTYYPYYQDVSRPLGEMALPVPDHPGREVKAIRALPSVDGPQPPGGDAAVQSAATTATTLAPTAGTGFPGIGAGDYGFTVQYAPPDTNLAVGPNHVVQVVNVAFAVWSKSGAVLKAPSSINSVWSGFGAGCQTNNDGDPIVNYDKFANRWVISQFSVSTLPYLQCVAVSTSSDPLGTYNRYAFAYGNTQFPDYPKMSVWPDGYYVTYNIFNNASTFGGAKVCAFDRAAMVAGAAATQQCFQLSTSYGGLLPADADAPAMAPAAGAAALFVNKGSNALNIWSMHVDWANPANTTLTGPTSLGVAAFSSASGSVATQPGTSQKLDSLGDRLMYRLAYRRFTGFESMVVNHSVMVGSGRKAVMGVRWYELRRTASAWSVYQQGTFSPDASHRWMGSIAADKQGNLGLAFSASSSSVAPSIRYTGRLVTDTLGTLQTEATLKAGVGSQQRNLSRWGDYSSTQVDPSDDCTFWFTSEYLKANGTFNWSTWIAPFKHPGCI